jgi:hypothetical protein
LFLDLLKNAEMNAFNHCDEYFSWLYEIRSFYFMSHGA